MKLPFHIFAVSHGPLHFSRRTHEAGHISIATGDCAALSDGRTLSHFTAMGRAPSRCVARSVYYTLTAIKR